MDNRASKRYCSIDHSNKQRELARQTPYQFWLNQVSRNRVDASSTPCIQSRLRKRQAG